MDHHIVFFKQRCRAMARSPVSLNLLLSAGILAINIIRSYIVFMHILKVHHSFNDPKIKLNYQARCRAWTLMTMKES